MKTTSETTLSEMPDFSQVLSQIDFDKKPVSHTAQRGRDFSVSRWNSFIIEVIAYPNDLDSILDEYNLTPAQYAELLDNPLFKAMKADTESTLQALAHNGGFQLSARRVAEQSLTVIEEILAHGENKDKLKAAELVTRLANLDPLIQAKQKEPSQGSSGIQLVVNLGGGMPLPQGFKGKESVIIDTVAEVTDDGE